MANRIKNDSIFIVARALTDSNAFKVGDVIGNYKDDSERWIAKDGNGKRWQHLITDLTNRCYFEIIGQYSMNDIIYYLENKNDDYQTVMWEMLVDAVKTTFKESRVTSLDNIYKYIVENLI